MVEIKSTFLHTYAKTLGSFIKVCLEFLKCCIFMYKVFYNQGLFICFQGDTSGDYRRILLCIAGEQW